MKSNPITDHLEVTVRSRDKNYFTGRALSISSQNAKGPFDILPMHANFITLLTSNVNIKKETGEEQIVKIEKGVLRVMSGKVDVFVESLA